MNNTMSAREYLEHRIRILEKAKNECEDYGIDWNEMEYSYPDLIKLMDSPILCKFEQGGNSYSAYYKVAYDPLEETFEVLVPTGKEHRDIETKKILSGYYDSYYEVGYYDILTEFFESLKIDFIHRYSETYPGLFLNMFVSDMDSKINIISGMSQLSKDK